VSPHGGAAEVARHPPPADEDLDRGGRGADVGALPDELIGDAVVVAPPLDVVVDVDLRLLPGRVLVRALRERLQRRPVELRKEARP
jgi:hypothetical protein